MAPQKQAGSLSPTTLYIRTWLWMGKLAVQPWAGKPVTWGFICVGLGTNTSPREIPLQTIWSVLPLNLVYMRDVKIIWEYNKNCREWPWTRKAESEATLWCGCISWSDSTLPCPGSVCMHLKFRREILPDTGDSSKTDSVGSKSTSLSAVSATGKGDITKLLFLGDGLLDLRAPEHHSDDCWDLSGIWSKSTLYHHVRGLKDCSTSCSHPRSASPWSTVCCCCCSQLPAPACSCSLKKPAQVIGSTWDWTWAWPQPGPACHACLKPPAINSGGSCGGNRVKLVPLSANEQASKRAGCFSGFLLRGNLV